MLESIMSFRVRLLPLVVLAVLAPVRSQDRSSQPAAGPPQDTAPAVSVPTFPNSTCPIMGKKVSMKLHTDTEFGRIYICCKGCDKKIHKDVATAYKTAYPTTKTVDNASCPVSGEQLGEKAVAVTLQGHAFRVCCPDCVPETKRNAQVVLTRVTRGGLSDLRNAECPITGAPVIDNAFALIGEALVRLSSPACVAAVAKDPAGALAKARAGAAAKPLADPRRRAEAAPEQSPPAPSPQPAGGEQKPAARKESGA